MNVFEKIFSEFNKAKLKYLVVGGVAVSLHGYLRATGDLDILLLLEKENLEKMDKIMKKLNYCERLPVTIMSLQDRDQVKKWIEEKNMTAYSFAPPSYNPLMIDVLMEDSLKFKKIYSRKVIKRYEGINIPIINIDDLIKMKKRAGRDKDLLDLKNLLILKGL